MGRSPSPVSVPALTVAWHGTERAGHEAYGPVLGSGEVRMRRRSMLSSLAVGALVGATGCIGVLTGEESVSFAASPATVSEGALEGTGYGLDEQRTDTITRAFSVAGQEREVEVTNHVAIYNRSVELGPLGEQELAMFVALATPQVRVLDRTFNPVGEMSNRELLDQLQSDYESLEVGSRVGSREVPILGESATVERFDGEATYDGVSVGLFFHITTVAHDDDYVVGIGIYPERLPEEESRVVRLYEGLRH